MSGGERLVVVVKGFVALFDLTGDDRAVDDRFEPADGGTSWRGNTYTASIGVDCMVDVALGHAYVRPRGP